MSAELANTGGLFDPHRRPISARVTLDLPEPPSSNELFANVSHARRAAARAQGRALPGRVKSSAYKTWLNAAGWMINGQRPGRVAGPYQLTILAGHTGKDLGNLEKALSDLLVEHGIVDDDAFARRITLERSDEMAARTIRVTIQPAGAA